MANRFYDQQEETLKIKLGNEKRKDFFNKKLETPFKNALLGYSKPPVTTKTSKGNWVMQAKITKTVDDNFIQALKSFVIKLGEGALVCTYNETEKLVTVLIPEERVKNLPDSLKKTIKFTDFYVPLPKDSGDDKPSLKTEEQEVNTEPELEAEILPAVEEPENKSLGPTLLQTEDLNNLADDYFEHLQSKRFIKGKDFFFIRPYPNEGCVKIFCSSYESFSLIRNASQDDYSVGDDSGDRTDLHLRIFSTKPAQTETATPVQEIVAPSNLNSNLQNPTTEMEDLNRETKKRGRKPAEALSEEQLKKLTALMSEVRKALKEKTDFKSGKHYINILLNKVQNVVAINGKSNSDALQIANELKVLGFDVDPVKEGKQTVLVKGNLAFEKKSDDQSPEATSELGKAILGTNFVLDSKNDENREEVVTEQKPLFPVNYQINDGVDTNKLFNDFKDFLDDYAKRGAEIIRLQEKLVVAEAQAPGLTENEMLILGGKLHDLIVASEMPTLFSKELFLEKLFFQVFMENQK